MLKQPKLLYEKYDEVWILSPSVKEWSGILNNYFIDLFLPKENYCNELSWDFISKNIDRVNNENREYYLNVLIIIDV